MASLYLKLIDELEVPEGTKIHLSRMGETAHIELPTGEILKPWIIFEKMQPNGDGDGFAEESDLNELGIQTDLRFTREIMTICGKTETVKAAEEIA